MSILVIAEHDNVKIKTFSLNAINAALIVFNVKTFKFELSCSAITKTDTILL